MGYCPKNPYEDNRIISLDAILMIQNNQWTIDMAWLEQLANDAPEEEPEPVDKGSRPDTRMWTPSPSTALPSTAESFAGSTPSCAAKTGTI